MDNRLRNRGADPENLRSKDARHDRSPERTRRSRSDSTSYSKSQQRNVLSLLVYLIAAAGLIYLGGRLASKPAEQGLQECLSSNSTGSDDGRARSSFSSQDTLDDGLLDLEHGIVRSVLQPFTQHKGPLPESRFLAHAPGFSVIQNAYYDSRRNRWYFIAPHGMPWTFPDMKYVVTPGKGIWDDWADPLNDRNVKDQTREAAEVLMGSEEACRLLDLPPLSGNQPWPDEIEVVPGNTVSRCQEVWRSG